MIEEELFDEVKQSKGIDESCLFSKEEWDSLIEWRPISNIPDAYEKAPKEVKEYNNMYKKLWLKKSR